MLSNLGYWLLSLIFWGVFLLKYLDAWPKPSIWSLILLAIGLVVGNLLVNIDRQWLQPYYGGRDLMTQSLLFLLVMAPLGLFVVTSTGSLLGVGLVVGFELQTTWQMIKLCCHVQTFHQTFLLQLKRQLSRPEIKVMVGLQVGVTALLILLSLI